MKKRIAIVVDYKYRTKWFTGLAYSYYRAFQKKGFECQIVEFNINPFIYLFLKKYSPTKIIPYLRTNQKPIIDSLNRFNSEIVFVVKGFYLLPETIDILKKNKKKIFCYYPDNPLTHSLNSPNFYVKDCINHYDCYFTWNKKLIAPLKNTGNKNIFHLPFAADVDLLHHNINRLPVKDYQMAYDISFIGNGDQERIQFLNTLSYKINKNYRKSVMGAHWESLNGFIKNNEVYASKFINTILKTRINLNILRSQNKDSHNMRTFEIPATGGCMLHEYSNEAIGFLEPNLESFYYKDVDDCADKIETLMKDKKMCQKVAKAGHEKLISGKHLYTDRVEQFWEIISTL